MTRFVKLPRHTAEDVLRAFDSGDWGHCEEYAVEFRKALAPKAKSWRAPAKKEREAKKAAERAEKNAETARIRTEVHERSGGRCEVCNKPLETFDPGEMDHFVGRKHAPQTVENCWFLCRTCHREKTNNRPSADYWLMHFAMHCERHGYQVEQARALNRLHYVRAKAGGR